MNALARIFDRSRQDAAAFTRSVFREFRRADHCMEVVFYRIIVVVMLLLAPPAGVLAFLIGMGIGTAKIGFALLKSAYSHRPWRSDRGGL